MTKEVLVTIVGEQLNSEEQPIHVTTPGVYHFRSGKHYIQYEEQSEDGGIVLKNTIKIVDNSLNLIKKGTEETQMNFNLSQTTDTIYHTPYGGLHLQVHTTELSVEELVDEIKVNLLYQLSSNDSILSDNHLMIRICSR